jgi:hypothetical protein
MLSSLEPKTRSNYGAGLLCFTQSAAYSWKGKMPCLRSSPLHLYSFLGVALQIVSRVG